MKAISAKHGDDYITRRLGGFQSCMPGNLCHSCIDDLEKIWLDGSKQIGRCTVPMQTGIRAKIMSLSIYSWNTAGLLCTDLIKRKAKLQFLENMFNRATIIGLQETHDDGDSSWTCLRQQYGNSFVFVRSALSSAAGGVMIAVKKSYSELFTQMQSFSLIPGRMVAATLNSNHINVAFICVHIFTNPNDLSQKIQMLRILLRFVRTLTDHITFIFGDFNFITDACDRTHLATGVAAGRVCSLAKYWLDEFEQFDELYQRSHTRFPGRLGAGGSSARIDRIYCNAPLEAFALWSIQTATMGHLPNSYLSDHLAVVSKVGYKNDNYSRCKIPDFVTKESHFVQLLEKLIDEHEFSECCWARVSEMKDIMYCAYNQYRESATSKESSPVQERIFWALQALRANDCEDIQLFISALGSVPELKHPSFSGVVPITEVHVASIRRMLREALASDDAARMEELKQADQLQDYEKQKTKESMMKKLALHNPKRGD